jgi:hypothetical protein
MEGIMNISEPSILIRINKKYHDGISRKQLFEVTRGVWKIGLRREKAQLAFAVYKGIVKEVYVISSWHPAGTLQYQTRTRTDVAYPGRWEFDGKLASQDIRDKYIDESVAEYFSPHAQNPITYVNCGSLY